MRKTAAVVVCVLVLCSLAVSQSRPAPSTNPDTPFKLANLAGAERGKPALLVKDRVYELNRANAWATQQFRLSTVQMPKNNVELIEQYDQLKPSLYQIANALAAAAPDFGVVPDSAKFMAPILYPWNLLAVAVNYRAHGQEMNREIITDYDKEAPFIFAKSSKAGLISPGDSVVIPEGRERIDWEVEQAIIIGHKAKNVRRDQADNYIFGYGVILDISDRGSQPRKSPLFNVDWFAGKSRDTFAPMAAYIVPAEFLKNHGELRLKLAVNGQVMQDSNTSNMVHNVEDLVAYISSIQTLEPADIIASGTPEGVGNGRKPPIFLKHGDVITAEIEGIGAIRTPVK